MTVTVNVLDNVAVLSITHIVRKAITQLAVVLFRWTCL